jgi:hypothetical protein
MGHVKGSPWHSEEPIFSHQAHEGEARIDEAMEGLTRIELASSVWKCPKSLID